MIALGIEPEPLAFRVRPLADECFDSWIERVAAAHETNRAGLFRYLGIDVALASLDLARGARGVAEAFHPAVDHMVERLAWAVQIAREAIEGTFLAVDASALLPRRLRCYACARCWQEALRAGVPRIVCKEWILRMSWRCGKHDLPLRKVPVTEGRTSEPDIRVWLGKALAMAETLHWGLDFKAAMIERNGACLEKLILGNRRRLRIRHQGYLDRFEVNLYHFARDRIAMLALAHSRVDRAVWGFERLVAMALPERPGRNGASLQRPKRSPRNWRVGQGRASSRSIEANLLDVVLAYGHVRERRDAQACVPVQCGRFASAGFQSAAAELP